MMACATLAGAMRSHRWSDRIDVRLGRYEATFESQFGKAELSFHWPIAGTLPYIPANDIEPFEPPEESSVDESEPFETPEQSSVDNTEPFETPEQSPADDTEPFLFDPRKLGSMKLDSMQPGLVADVIEPLDTVRYQSWDISYAKGSYPRIFGPTSWPFGFGIDRYQIGKGAQLEYLGIEMPYWAVLVPQIILSTWLLLSQRRSDKPKLAQLDAK